MPSKNEYDLVPNDDYDARLPLHSDKAFHHGITFQAKYIGSMDVPRPTSRVEIVAAMRRIRYEFKAKGIKKKKVTIEVSVDGVRVTLRKVKKKKQFLDEGKALILSHPIYRIFYVSHDSQDLKIFSYIARDGSSNVFKCNVFKSSKKSQAMRVVRTVGQAFEVCHKLSITNPNDQEQDDKESSDHLCQDVQKDAFSNEKSSNLYVKKEPFSENNVSERSSIRLVGEDPNDRLCSESISDTNPSEKPISSLNLDILPSSSNSNFTRRQEVSASETHVSPDIERLSNMSGILPTASSTLSAHHELHLLREQLEQQTQQTQAALAQVQLLRDQLAAEQSARLEAQARTHQLLTHNKELLDHITALLSHLQDNERTTLHGQQQNTVQPPITMVPQQLQGLCEPYQNDRSENQFLEQNPMYQTMGFIENPAATSCLPLTPRSAFSLNSFGALDNNQQVLQKLQSIYGYTPSNISFPSYPSYSSLYPPVYNPQSTLNSLNTSSFTLQSPQQLQSSPLPMRHPQFRTNIMHEQKSNAAKPDYQKQQKQEQHREHFQGSNKHDVKCEEETQFIRPLSQVGTLTTTDYDGKVKVIVPVPSGAEDAGDLLKALRLNDESNKPHNVTTIQRTTSEKVPNRSELMSQVQRTGWARHTTK